jgi:hypothetical protein
MEARQQSFYLAVAKTAWMKYESDAGKSGNPLTKALGSPHLPASKSYYFHCRRPCSALNDPTALAWQAGTDCPNYGSSIPDY